MKKAGMIRPLGDKLLSFPLKFNKELTKRGFAAAAIALADFQKMLCMMLCIRLSPSAQYSSRMAAEGPRSFLRGYAHRKD